MSSRRVVLTGADDLSQVNPVTWVLVGALAVASAVRLALYLARGRPRVQWLEPVAPVEGEQPGDPGRLD